MAFALVAGGTSLYVFYPDGTSQLLTLPAGVEMSTRRLRGAVLQRYVIAVNGPTQGIAVDGDNNVYQMNLRAPHHPPTVAAGAAGTLSGTFRVKVSFCIKDPVTGDLIAESPLSSESAEVTVASQVIALTNIPTSGTPGVNCRRLYRTTTGGATFYEWFDLDDNTTTSASEEGADEALPTTPVDEDLLGAPPAQIELIAEWKGRLWAKSPADPDRLFGTAERIFYGWPLEFEIGPVGRDLYGVTGFLPRRDELAIARRDIIWKLSGDDADTFRVKKLVEGVGVLAPDSCLVIRDIGFFLGIKQGQVGLYTWDSDGVRCVSDDRVDPWFNTDDYFARAEFPNSFAAYNPVTDAYELYLAAAGGTTINRWISFGLSDGKFLGPHLTSAFTPTYAGVLLDSNEVARPVIGASDGKLYTRSATRTDGTATAIALDLKSRFHYGEPPAPDIDHYFGELAVLSKKQSAGTLTITPTIKAQDGNNDEAEQAQTAISHDLTTGRERLPRLGTGRGVQLRFQESTAGQDVELYGYEIPWHEVGRR